MTREGGESGAVRRARARIREIRMRDVVVRLADRQGKPLGRVPVEIQLERHAFPFGNMVWELAARVRNGEGKTEAAAVYRRRFRSLFNAANNLCYWTEREGGDAAKVEPVQGEWNVEDFADTVAWTRSEGMIAKGHPLVWTVDKAVPAWVQRYDSGTFMKFLEVRVRNLVARFRGKVAIWDAVNEPMWEAAPKNLTRRNWPHMETIRNIADYIAPVLRWCREEDPDAVYVVNDYGMEMDWREDELRGSDGSLVTAASQRKRFLTLVAALADRGTPPGAIGLQSHGRAWLPPEQQVAVYDQFGASGFPVHITEFSAGAAPPAAQGTPEPGAEERLAEYVADYLTCAFGHPAVEAFFFWGLHWGGTGKRPSDEPGAVWRRVHRLIHEEWTTKARAVTSADGTVRFRGFLGDYTLRYAHSAAAPAGVPFTVGRATGKTVHLTAPLPPSRRR